MTVIGILFEKRIVDDSGFPRTPDRPVELLGTRVRYPRSVKTTIGACGPDSLGGSATWTHPMELLGDVGHVESRFCPFGDGVSVSAT